MKISPRFHGGVDLHPSFTFDDLANTKFTIVHFLSQFKKAILSPFKTKSKIGKYTSVFFPMHQTKYVQMKPMEEVFGSQVLFILVPWNDERIATFNTVIKHSGKNWTFLESVWPLVFWFDLFVSLPYWVHLILTNPSIFARRLMQFIEIYGLVHGIVDIVFRANAALLVTAYEDSSYSSAVSQYAKSKGFITVNVMHGNCYRHDQFFDVSLLFGEYHRRYLESNTDSSTRFVVSGSVTIKDENPSPKYQSANQLILFDQPSCDAYPARVKAQVVNLLGKLLENIETLTLTIKPHPVGIDEHSQALLMSRPNIRRLPANSSQPTAILLLNHGISITAFSTAGLEAIASGTVSLFVNPGGVLKEGPLAFMQDFTFRDSDSLLSVVARLVGDKFFYSEYLKRQKLVLGQHYLLTPFDYKNFLSSLNLFGSHLPIS